MDKTDADFMTPLINKNSSNELGVTVLLSAKSGFSCSSSRSASGSCSLITH